MAVNRKEFADRMAENGGITKKAAFEAVGVFIETLLDYLSEDEKVMFSGFGRFEIRTMKEKVGNLRGIQCIIPAHEYVGFHASDTLMDKIKERRNEDINESTGDE